MINYGVYRGSYFGANGGANDGAPWREWARYAAEMILIGYHGTRQHFERFDLDHQAGASGLAARGRGVHFWSDKRKAVMTLLRDAEWSGWTDSEIARRCAVHQTTVMRTRESLMQSIGEQPRTRTFTTKHGTVATMNTANGSILWCVVEHEFSGLEIVVFDLDAIRVTKPAMTITEIQAAGG